MNGTFYLPTRLFTGAHCVRKNSEALTALGTKCLLITGARSAKASGALDDVTASLEAHDISYAVYDGIKQNPLLADSYEAAQLAVKEGAQFIVGIGGGSPLDAAKAVAIYAANPDLALADIFKLNWKNRALPVVAVGTTAGTGSEVTQFAVMTTPEGIKRSIAHPQCFPTLAYGDYRYTLTLPRAFTVSTALDALSHALEGYFSTAAGDVSDLFALEATSILWKRLNELKALAPGAEITPEQREDLYRASVMAGFTLAQCGTCYCHSLGYFLSEEHGVAHGTACAIYLPGFLRRESALLPDKAARLMGFVGCTLEDLCALIDELTEPVEVRLSDGEIGALVDRVDGTPNMVKTAPAGVGREETAAILKALYQ